MGSVERCGDCRRPIVSADDRWTRNNGYRVQCTVYFDAESDGTRARLAEIEAAQAMRDVLDDARGIVEVRVASDDGDSQRLVALARALLSCDRERDAAQHAADALRTALDGLRAAVLREREAMERDTLRGLSDALRADNVRLRAIVEGREHPPTPDEAEAHYRAGGGWLYARAEGCRASVAAVPMTVRSIACAADYQRETLRWWPLDATGRPCPWPTALDAGEGR